MKEYKYMYS